jgi:protein-L-isoaspartate O-methyltransferase
MFDDMCKLFMTPVLSRTAINGLLHRGSMFVLSSKQFRSHLLCSYSVDDASALPRKATLLDIGAGDGAVTARLAGLFTTVYVTEASTVMQFRLRRRGYE